MQKPTYVLIDGSQAGDTDLAPIFTIRSDILAENGVDVQTLTLRNLKLGHKELI